MNDPFRNLERLERQLGELAFQLTRVHFSSFGAPDQWRPAINAYRCLDCFVICVDLAGVERHTLAVRTEPFRLLISGMRPPPEPPCDDPYQVIKVMAMEINYGAFGRVLDLPEEVDPKRVRAEQRDGLLWIHLPLQEHS